MRKAVVALACIMVLAVALPAVVKLASAQGINENQVTQWREGDLVVYPLAYPLDAAYGSPLSLQFVVINATLSHAAYIQVDNTTIVLSETKYYSFSVDLAKGVHSFAVLTNASILYSTLFRVVVPPPPPPPEQTWTYTLGQLVDLRTGVAQTAMLAGLVGGVLGAASKRYTKVTVWLLVAVAGIAAGLGWAYFATLYVLAIGALVYMATYYLGGETCEYVMLTRIQGEKFENHIYQAANNYTISGMTLRRKKIEIKDAKPLKFSLPRMENVTLHFVKDIVEERHFIKATADKAFSQALIDAKIVEKLDTRLKDSELERSLLHRATKSSAMQILRDFEEIVSTHRLDSGEGMKHIDKALEELKQRVEQIEKPSDEKSVKGKASEK